MTTLCRGVAGLLLLCGCAGILDIDDDASPGGSSSGQSTSSGGSGDDDDDSSGTSSSGSSSSSGNASSSSSGGIVLGTFDETRDALEALRLTGPVTLPQDKIHCSDARVFWREGDGTLHSYSGLDDTTVDYAFVAPTEVFFQASDAYVAISTPSYSGLQVFRATDPYELVTNLPRTRSFAATGSGVLRFAWTETPQTEPVLHWSEAGGEVDASQSIDNEQPPSSYGHGTLVVPGGAYPIDPTFLINLVFDDGSPNRSVLFDGGVALSETLATARGLVIVYTRTNTTAVRLYVDDTETRHEVSDEIATLPAPIADEPVQAHLFLGKVAAWGSKLIYGARTGIWSFDLQSGVLAPVQLGPGVADSLCVMPNAGLLAYRLADNSGRIWLVPLEPILGAAN